MNLENNPTVEQLRDLLKKCDDRAGHHVLWVGKDGVVHVSRVPKDVAPAGVPGAGPDVQLRYETFEAGNEYVGPEAAADEDWVNQVFGTLVAEWPKAKGKPTAEYVGI